MEKKVHRRLGSEGEDRQYDGCRAAWEAIIGFASLRSLSTLFIFSPLVFWGGVCLRSVSVVTYSSAVWCLV